MHVFRVYCLKTALWLFLEQGLAFLVKTGWQPWPVLVCALYGYTPLNYLLGRNGESLGPGLAT